MSATTPGMRQIWMDTVVRCVDQRTANVCDDRRAQTSSTVDSTDLKSDVAGQPIAASAGGISDHKQTVSSVASSTATAVKRSRSVPEKTDVGLSSVARLPSSDIAQRTDSQTADVVRCFLLFHFLYSCFIFLEYSAV